MRAEQRRLENQLQRVRVALGSATPKPSKATASPKPGRSSVTGAATSVPSGATAAPTKTTTPPDELNTVLVEEVMTRVLETQRIINGHHARLRWTYAVYMVLAVLMFLAGLALLFMPLFDRGNPERIDLWLSAIGGAEIVALLIFSPFQRIQGMMGDMTQVILLMEGYLHQVALRLLQCRVADPKSVGSAAYYIYVTTRETARLIQDYFENAPGTVTSGLLSRRGSKSPVDPAAFGKVRERLDGLQAMTQEALDAAAEAASGAHAVRKTVRKATNGVSKPIPRLPAPGV